MGDLHTLNQMDAEARRVAEAVLLWMHNEGVEGDVGAAALIVAMATVLGVMPEAVCEKILDNLVRCMRPIIDHARKLNVLRAAQPEGRA